MMRLLLSVCLLLVAARCGAQRILWYELSYDRPSCNLYWIYKPAAGNRLGYSFTGDDQQKEWGFFLGFNRWQPKQDTFYYADNPGVGKAIFSNYYILQVAMHFQHSFLIEKKVRPVIGIDAGYYYYTYEYEEHDNTHDLQGSIVEGRFALCPQAGVQLNTKHIRVGLQVRYNFYISIGSSDARDWNYNPDVGKFDYFWSGSIILGYLHHHDS